LHAKVSCTAKNIFAAALTAFSPDFSAGDARRAGWTVQTEKRRARPLLPKDEGELRFFEKAMSGRGLCSAIRELSNSINQSEIGCTRPLVATTKQQRPTKAGLPCRIEVRKYGQ
jgi:hypothetical protein